MSEGLSPVSVTGITESARADFISALLRDQKKNGFVIVESMLDARVLKEDLEFYFEKTPVEIFPARDYIFHNIETADMQLYHKRIELLERIARGEELVVIAPLDAVLQLSLILI